METVIYAGEAHAQVLPGSWILGDAPHQVILVKDDHPGAVQFRKGFFLGDGTGCGKGREIAGVIADNLAQGRSRAVWLSKNDALLEDARRDWSAIGGANGDITPQSAWKQADAIRMDRGILYLDLRHPAPAGPGRSALAPGPDRRLAGGGLRRGDRLRRGPRHGQRRRRRQGRARDQEGLAAGHGRAGPAEPPAQRPHPLRLGDRRHDAGEPGLCRAAGPLGRAGSALPHPRRLHGRGRDRRRGGDGADRARAEGHGPLHRPLAVVRRRRIRGPASSAHGG